MANNKKPSSSSITIIAAGAVAVLSLIAAIVYGKSLLSEILLNQRVLSAKSKALDQVKSNEAAAPKLVEDYHKLGLVADYIDRSLPSNPDYPATIAVLERIGNVSSVRIKSVAPAPGTGSSSSPTSGNNVTSTPYVLSVEGSYVGLMQFLQNIQKASWPMQVKTMSVSGESSAMKADLNINVFYKGPAVVELGKEAIK